MKRIVFLFVVVGLSGEAAAAPFEAIGAFVSKLFKGGAVAKNPLIIPNAVVNGRKLLPAAESSVRAAPVTRDAFEPKPNTDLEPIAESRKDADEYKTLRRAANERGDADAMLIMSDMILTNKVSDPGEPYHAYWLYHAARYGGSNAVASLRHECIRSDEKRKTDRWFASACGTIDSKTINADEGISDVFSRYQNNPVLPSQNHDQSHKE